MYLLEEPKRQKVLKVLSKALALLEAGRIQILRVGTAGSYFTGLQDLPGIIPKS
jgi:hypothetical protein